MSRSWNSLTSISNHPVVILGHRGARHAHPENTMSAFQAAMSEGAWGTEFDVRLSADDVPVVIHDEDLARVTKGRDTRKVNQLTAAQLAKVDLGQNQTIPELRSTIDWAVSAGALLNIELKSNRPLRDSVANIVASLLHDYPNARDFALVSSFHPTLLMQFKSACPEVMTGLLLEPQHPCLWHRRWLELLRASAIHPPARLILNRPELLAQTRGHLVNTWTVNDEAQAAQLQAMGVSSLISDRPGALVKHLKLG
jgi:glycerophosphoryl diester phosphodiesterase